MALSGSMTFVEPLKSGNIGDYCRSHMLSCGIGYSGESLPLKYFIPNVKSDIPRKGSAKCSFRGHPVLGDHVHLPENYVGVVLKSVTEESTRNLILLQPFVSFTAWDWDQEPLSSVGCAQALEWMFVSSAIHREVS